jgi:hypothetical protein
MIKHGDQNFYLDILETKPQNGISIVEADVNVEFAPPKDAPKEQKNEGHDNFTFRTPDDSKGKQAMDTKDDGSDKAGSLNGWSGLGSSALGSKSGGSSSSSNAGSTSASDSSSSSYFANLKGGHTLAKKKQRPPGSSPSMSPMSKPADSPMSAGLPGPMGLARSTSTPARGSQSGPNPNASNDSSPANSGPGTPRFQYEYTKPTKAGEQPRLLRRHTKPSNFQAFAGPGHSLKSSSGSSQSSEKKAS